MVIIMPIYEHNDLPEYTVHKKINIHFDRDYTKDELEARLQRIEQMPVKIIKYDMIAERCIRSN